MAKKAYIGVQNFTPRGLPSGYTELEYIESSGTQHIDTGVPASSDTYVRMDFVPLSTGSPFGVIGSMGSGDYYGINCYNSAFEVYWGSGLGFFSSYSNGTKYRIDFNVPSSKVVSVNGTAITTLGASPITNKSIYLLTLNVGGTSTMQSISARIYSCQIYNGNALVRDFVPAKNSSGAVGLYDLKNSKFYANAGSGTFTAGSASGSYARQIKKWYRGVDGIARKVKKAYIGVNGTARQFFGGGELKYYGKAPELSHGRFDLAATSIGDYALFGGGYKQNILTVMDAYSSSFVKSLHTNCNSANKNAATSIGDYALFGGGDGGNNTAMNVVVAYNKSLVRSLPTALSVGLSHLAATSIGDYALFGGGIAWEYDWDYGGNSRTYKNTVNAYNASLTRSTPTTLTTTVWELAATTVGNYALFGGGAQWTTTQTTVNAYNGSLTKTNPTAFSTGRQMHAATCVGNYALFGGGVGTDYKAMASVEVYNSSLTRSTTSLDINVRSLAATSVGDFAIFGGGSEQVNTSTQSATSRVLAFDSSLTKTVQNPLSIAKQQLAATSLGDYALFGGGWFNNYAQSSPVVDVYTVA